MSGEVQTGGVRTTQASWVRRWTGHPQRQTLRDDVHEGPGGRKPFPCGGHRLPGQASACEVAWSLHQGHRLGLGPDGGRGLGPRAGPSAPGSHPSPAPVWAAGRRERGRAAQVGPGCPRGSRAPAAPRACPAASRGARAALVCLHDNEQATDRSVSLTCPWVVRRVLRLGRGTPKSLVRICLDDIFRFRAAAGAIRKCWRSSRPLVSPFTPAASLHPGAG